MNVTREQLMAPTRLSPHICAARHALWSALEREGFTKAEIARIAKRDWRSVDNGIRRARERAAQ